MSGGETRNQYITHRTGHTGAILPGLSWSPHLRSVWPLYD